LKEKLRRTKNFSDKQLQSPKWLAQSSPASLMTGLPLLSESKASQRTILQAWNNIFKTMQRLQDENHQVSMFLNRTRAASTEKHHKKSVLDLLQQHPKKETNKTSSREQHS